MMQFINILQFFSYLHVCSTSFTAQFSSGFRYSVFFSQQFHNHLAWLRLCLCEPFFSSKSKEKVFWGTPSKWLFIFIFKMLQRYFLIHNEKRPLKLIICGRITFTASNIINSLHYLCHDCNPLKSQ